jgi:glutathione S-transferase
MMRILGRPNSINVQKAMWCAEELGLEVERLDVGGAFGGNDLPDYLAKNPNGLVPTLVDGDFVLWESNSIVRYLAETYGDGSWLPRGERARALASQWMDWQLSALGIPMRDVFWGLIRTPPEERDPDLIEGGRRKAAVLWAMVDDYLDGRTYVAGDTPTIGDIPLGAFVHRWYALPIERPELSHLRAWYDRLSLRPAYRKHVMLPLS